MKLFLHVGPEKTGSSHIQTLCVNAREQLRANGVWFPEGIPRHEKRMRAGLVSAGNAFLVSDRVRKDDHNGVQELLFCYREEAQARDCRSVFLTSELLLPYCSTPMAWQKLVHDCRKASFLQISILLVLRDPMDQLVSLYKHRARGGRAGRVDVWARQGYHLPGDLERLRTEVDPLDIELVARGYTRRPGGLEELVFTDWLQINPPSSIVDGEINPSLSLSELELLRSLNEKRPELVPILHERLSAVPSGDKVQGAALEVFAQAVAESTVWHNREEWQRWNALLPPGEALAIPETAPEIPPWPSELGFSARQFEALAGLLAEAATIRFQAELFWRSRIRPAFGRIARAVGVRR